MLRAALTVSLLLPSVPLLAASSTGGVGIGDSVIRPIISQREKIAIGAMDDFEKQLSALQSMPNAERVRGEKRLGGTLEELVNTCDDTKLVNKALYLLAYWRFNYQDGKNVEPLLDKIRGTTFPGFQNPAEALRVQLYLKQGRLLEARTIADRLVANIPEMSGLTALCAFYERVGSPAPKTAGTPLGASVADPAQREVPWLLYYFTGTLDAAQKNVLANVLAETSKEAYAGVLRVVVVAEGVNPLALISAFSQVPNHENVDLLWSNPAEAANVEGWSALWRPPVFPCSALLGPDRTIVAVQPTLADLGVLIGKMPKAATATPIGPRGNKKASWQR